jgi:hypothetical protein
LIGQKFGSLVVIKKAGKDHWNKTRWLCLCDCKRKARVSTSDLTRLSTKTCGACPRTEGNKYRRRWARF